jgi:5-methylcytosine-specific restriction protein B
MDLDLKGKIEAALQHPTNVEMINAEDFYFQEAKDALQDFLELELSEESKSFLLAKRKQYNELKQLFEDSSDLIVFGKLIFSVIVYCDANAHKKQELNAYDDKRVLALAFVRMNHWVEQLITYKFEGHLPEGSVKNAIEYLLNPRDNFTMLSENHRNQISQNLFKKPYNNGTFKEDFFNFFSTFSITVNNVDNYTHLLTRLCYSKEIEKLWKDTIIGLICPDRTGWQENAIKDTASGNYIALWNHKKPNGRSSTLKLLRQCIDENDFFRIFYTANYNVVYVAEIVDFVSNQDELQKVKWPENFGNVEWYNTNFADYKDGTKSAAWIYLARKIEKVNSVDYHDFNYYKDYSYPSVGCQAPVVSYKTSFEINFRKQMDKNIELLKYKKQIILQGPPGTGKTREAKLIAKEMLGLKDSDDLKYSEQFRLIQFHPSYTYEDFVRGIVAKPNPEGEGMLYEAEDKTLGAFAKKALKNFVDSKKDLDTISKEAQINEYFDSFAEYLNDEIENKSGFYPLTGNVGLISTDDTAAFRYKGRNDGWLKNGNRILFKDILESYFAGDKTRQEIKKNAKISGLARQHASYFVRVLNLFQKYLEDNNLNYEESTDIRGVDVKNYVLVVDEINRANLSSVLGELIYALEYRGEAVESMYAVEDESKNKLILPPNLYIIGTMNTADRSVGHIDYAIRRRFAFVDVPTENLKKTQGLQAFDDVLFDTVTTLFDTNLSPEFEKKDVQLGHSYFIDKGNDKDGVSMDIRLEYEIKPILREYVRDGVLIGESIKQKIEDLNPSI